MPGWRHPGTASRRSRGLLRLLQSTAACALLTLLPVAQGSGEGRAERDALDPYSEGDPAVLEALGYRGLGPFLYGGGKTTEAIELELGGVPLLWVETEHFQLGLSLEPMPLPREPRAKKRLLAELGDLRERLPNLPRKPKKLDPWLLLHLHAARLERAYAAFVTQLGLDQRSFTPPPPAAGLGPPATQPLGTGGPICVLLTEKHSTLSRFTSLAFDMRTQDSLRSHFHAPRSQAFFGLALEGFEGDLRGDGPLHYGLVHGLVQVLASATRNYTGELQPWIRLGLAHWFARELVDDELLLYVTPAGAAARGRNDAKFEPKVRARAQNGAFPGFDEMLGWSAFDDLRFSDHMVSWSKVDFLLRADGGARAQELLWELNEPIEWGIPGREEQRLAAARAAVSGLGGSGGLEALDAAWREWVLETYAKR